MVIGCACLLVLALGLAWTGLGGMRRGLRAAESLTLVRGIRRLVTAIALGVLALGVLVWGGEATAQPNSGAPGPSSSPSAA